LLPGIPGGDASSFFASGRLPFLLTADVTINGVTERINFIDIHAKSGGDEDSRVRRAYDMQVLKDSLDAYYNDVKFVILGDLNDDLDESIVVGEATPYAEYVADSANYKPVTKALSNADARSTVSFNDVIDHQILSNELDELYIDGSARIFAPFSLIPNYATTTSDHLPVLSRFVFALPVVSFAAKNASITEGDSIKINLVSDKPFGSGQNVTVSGAGVAHFAAGSTTAFVTVVSLDNNVDEADETIILTIASSLAYQVGNDSIFNLTIIDNDLPSISFESAEISIAEGSGEHIITLHLSSPLSSSQSVTMSLANSHDLFYLLDYLTDPAPRLNSRIVLSIPANKTEVSFVIYPNKDLFRESEETVTFAISSVSNGINIGSQSTLRYI